MIAIRRLAAILAADRAPRTLSRARPRRSDFVRRQLRRPNRLFRVDVGEVGIHLRATVLANPDCKIALQKRLSRPITTPSDVVCADRAETP